MKAQRLTLFALPAVLAFAASHCATTPDATADVQVSAPDFNEFVGDANNPGVHAFLERRCGTLDCHGQVGRAFRLYSAGGLRMPNDAGLISGGGPDTPAELLANYQSLIGLQPEEMSRVVAHDDPPTSLLVVAKPLALQTHKGGQALATGDSGDACLESWLVREISLPACKDAAQVP